VRTTPSPGGIQHPGQAPWANAEPVEKLPQCQSTEVQLGTSDDVGRGLILRLSAVKTRGRNPKKRHSPQTATANLFLRRAQPNSPERRNRVELTSAQRFSATLFDLIAHAHLFYVRFVLSRVEVTCPSTWVTKSARTRT
jgi:hypothetical protein